MAMRNYRTAKGTELPLLNLRGKEYLEVKYRLVWFREDHPDWSIETELMSVTEVSAYARATVRDESGRIIATSHKFESVKGFPDFIEKAETGAIGRALALIGYGTQFCADELDEGARIVDAPANVVVRHGRQKEAPRFDKAKKMGNDENIEETAPAATQIENSMPDEEHSEEPVKARNPGDYTINFGRKYKGRKLKEIPRGEVESYIQWLENSSLKPGTVLSQQLQFLKSAFERFYGAEPLAAH
jgi:uncharacterized protein (DUF3820 family)